MRTKRLTGVSYYVATKKELDLAWEIQAGSLDSVDARTGVVDDPYWRKKIKAASDATHPYSRTLWPAKSSSPPWQVDWTWYWRETYPPKRLLYTQVQGNVCWNYAMSHSYLTGIAQDPAVSYATSLAKLAFLSKLKEETSPFAVLPFLGELKETVAMIRHPIRGIIRQNRNSARHFTRLQRLYRTKPARLEEMMEKAYLQWSYGVAPLINDIQNVLGMTKQLFDEPEIKRLRVTIPFGPNRVSGTAGATLFEQGTAPVWYQHATHATGSVRLSGAYKESLVSASREKLFRLAGLTLNDVVPAAWELSPYSFLADYFVNIGDVLGGVFTDTRGLVYAVTSTRIIQKTDAMIAGLPSVTGQVVSWPVKVRFGALVKVSFKREKANLAVGFRDIHWQDPSVGQLCKTAALSSQLLREVAFKFRPQPSISSTGHSL